MVVASPHHQEIQKSIKKLCISGILRMPIWHGGLLLIGLCYCFSSNVAADSQRKLVHHFRSRKRRENRWKSPGHKLFSSVQAKPSGRKTDKSKVQKTNVVKIWNAKQIPPRLLPAKQLYWANVQGCKLRTDSLLIGALASDSEHRLRQFPRRI